MQSTLRRQLAVGAFGIIGSSLAFLAGARVGNRIDHHTRSVSVAHVPVQDLKPSQPDDVPAPTPVARK